MDDLQIGAPAGGLLAEVHGATRLVVRTVSPSDAHKSSAIAPRRGTTLLASSTQEWRISAGFRASPSPQLLKMGLIAVVDRLRRRFAIGRVCVVADRGMVSAETIAALEARELLYIL